MTNWLKQSWLRWIFVSVGVVMLIGSVTSWIVYGFSVRKLTVAAAGGLFFALAAIGDRVVRVYKDVAVVLLNTLVLVVIVEGGAALVLRLVSSSDNVRDGYISDYFRTQEGGKAYAHELVQADRRNYVPYVIWKDAPFAGQFINIDQDGNRVTPTTRCDSNSYVVFMFGGSTMWGWGATDSQTIPAYFQTELSKSVGRPVCVRNFGQLGWVSTQSVIELLRHLQAGEIPNLVVFYDGLNDTLAASSAGVAGAHQDLQQIASRFKEQATPNPYAVLASWTSTFHVLELARSREPDSAPPKFESTIDRGIIRVYLTNHRAVRALSKEFGFDYAFFWQPTLLYGQKTLSREETILSKEFETLGNVPELVRSVYSQIKLETGNFDHLFFLADAFRDDSERLYIDLGHLVPGGNQKVAKRMADILVNRRDILTATSQSKLSRH